MNKQNPKTRITAAMTIFGSYKAERLISPKRLRSSSVYTGFFIVVDC